MGDVINRHLAPIAIFIAAAFIAAMIANGVVVIDQIPAVVFAGIGVTEILEQDAATTVADATGDRAVGRSERSYLVVCLLQDLIGGGRGHAYLYWLEGTIEFLASSH